MIFKIKMAITLVSLAVLTAGIVSGIPTAHQSSSYGSMKDFDMFFALIPTDKVLAIIKNYLANDPEVQDAFEFISSQDFKNLIPEIEGIPEYRTYLKYLQDNGLNVYSYIQKLIDALELPAFVSYRSLASSDLGVLIYDIIAVLPLDEINILYNETLEKRPTFANLVALLKEDDFKGVVEQLRENPIFQELIQQAKDLEFDISLIIDLLKIFVWILESRQFSAFSLDDYYQDLLALFDKQRLSEVYSTYIYRYVDVEDIFEYVRSIEFYNLLYEIYSISDYLNDLNKLQDNGLDFFKISKNLQENSPDIASLIEFFTTDERRGVDKKLYANSKIQEVFERAKSQGADFHFFLAIYISVMNLEIDYYA